MLLLTDYPSFAVKLVPILVLFIGVLFVVNRRYQKMIEELIKSRNDTQMELNKARELNEMMRKAMEQGNVVWLKVRPQSDNDSEIEESDRIKH